MRDSHSDIIHAITGYITPSITFQVTEECCLACTYCYQINKKPTYMTEETAKEIVDFLFEQHKNPHPLCPIKKETPGLILDFIGGEPLMNVKVIDYIADYFFNKCLDEQEFDWYKYSRMSMASNGMLYFEPDVQDFIQKWHSKLSMTFSIDGPKWLHDACRITKDGKGSFDKVKAALDDFKERYSPGILDETKVTIAPSNLKYLRDCATFFYDQGTRFLHANVIFEHEWTVEEAQFYYKELKYMADYLLNQDEDIQFSIFNTGWFKPLSKEDNNNWCGGTGAMLAFDPVGNMYPCIRYMSSSLGNDRSAVFIGTVKEGFFPPEKQLEVYKEFPKITRSSQSTKECFTCPVAAGCAWCSAWNYQEFGTVNKRSTRICWMHRAEALANVYYWNKYYQKHHERNTFRCYLDRKIALQIISKDEYDMLQSLIQQNIITQYS